ncbi:MAG: hypothetical protein ACTSRP_11635 [Candidatus Helarchaeota archaeon]
MLENLDKINWAEYGHAYGSATDVPDCIRGLASKDKEVREKALWKLYGNIYHQGTLYSATLPAIPFLFELLESSEVENKDKIVEYLITLAINSDSNYLPSGIDINKIFADEDAITTKVYNEISKRVPIFYPLLDIDDMVLKIRVIHALAWFPRHAKESGNIVRNILKSILDEIPSNENIDLSNKKMFKDFLILINGVISLALLDKYQNDNQDIEFFNLLMEKFKNPYIKGAGAVARAILNGGNLPNSVIENLLFLITLETALIAKRMPEKGIIGIWLKKPKDANVEDIIEYQRKLMKEIDELVEYKKSLFFIWNDRDFTSFIFLLLLSLNPELIIKHCDLMCETFLILRHTIPIILENIMIGAYYLAKSKGEKYKNESSKILATLTMAGSVCWMSLEFKESLQSYKLDSERSDLINKVLEENSKDVYINLFENFITKYPELWLSINSFGWEIIELNPKLSEIVGQFLIDLGKKYSIIMMWAFGNDLVASVYTKSGDIELVKKAIKLFEEAKSVNESFYTHEMYEEAKKILEKNK